MDITLSHTELPSGYGSRLIQTIGRTLRNDSHLASMESPDVDPISLRAFLYTPVDYNRYQIISVQRYPLIYNSKLYIYGPGLCIQLVFVLKN